MLKKVILHLGLAKTGSTVLQSVLFKNRERLLARHGILYPGEEDNHFHFHSYFSDHPHNLIQINRLGIVEEQAAREFLKNFISDFERQVDESKAQTLLLSSEYFSGMSEEELKRFGSYLGGIAEEVEVFAYVRDPWSFSISWLQQNLRDGLWKGPIRPSYYWGNVEILDKFAAALGVKPIVRPYVAINHKPFDVVDDFLHFLGVEETSGFVGNTLQERNAGVGWKSACIISHVNELFPSVDATGRYVGNPARDWVVEKIIEKSVNDEPIRMSSRTASEIRQYAEQHLARIHEVYLGGDDVFFRAYNEASFTETNDLISIDSLERGELLPILFQALYALAERAIKAREWALLAEQTISKRDSHIAQLDSHIAHLNSHIAHLNSHIAHLNSHIAQLNSHIAHLNQATADMQTSISWRITAPLRAAKQAIHKLIRK